MQVLQLQDQEIKTIHSLVDGLTAVHRSVESSDFWRESRTYAQELPRRVRRKLNHFRDAEHPGVLIVSGLPVDDAMLGLTPTGRKDRKEDPATLKYDLAFALVASLLGDSIGWATQQDGRIVHDVFPIETFKMEQIGWGSAETLIWHTEDAYHPLRADYVALMCLRNPDHVETTLADIEDVVLDDGARAVLSQPLFQFLPDESHRLSTDRAPCADDREGELRRRGAERVDRALASPEPVPVLFGDPRHPYLRLDPHYMKEPLNESARGALDTITAAVEAAMSSIVLAPGDMCFIDNYRVVHGRKSFKARFDGSDRWLRRLNVARDLRRSRDCRLSAESRVLY